MTSPKAPKDRIFEKVINPYLSGVLQHPQSIEMREGMLHIRDVEGPKKTGSMEARLEAMEQQVFKCQGMVERGLNANHIMITEFTSKHTIDANDIGKHLSRLYNGIDHFQAQIYDLQNQNCEYEYRFKSIRALGLGRIADSRTNEASKPSALALSSRTRPKVHRDATAALHGTDDDGLDPERRSSTGLAGNVGNGWIGPPRCWIWCG
ncbi:40S ribosomal protein S5-1 [Hordeum vulgare]|nr:40S ribosomal protein S5-1 [Hordeum vulgare]